MAGEAYLLFIGACVLLMIIPGPDMIYLLGRVVAQGRRAGVVAALGVNLGAYVHLAAVITGLSAILMSSALAFTVIKWMGAAYLVYLGVVALRSQGVAIPDLKSGVPSKSMRAVFWQGFWIDVLNPKVAGFYLAFLPQFVDPAAKTILGQLIILGLTVNIIALTINLSVVGAFEWFTRRLRNNKLAACWLQKAMGIVLIGLGVRLARERL